jgi:hypothetical protein
METAKSNAVSNQPGALNDRMRQQQADDSRPHPLMSVCRDLFLSRPGKPERVLENTQALSVGNEFRESLQHSARRATLAGHFGGIAS